MISMCSIFLVEILFFKKFFSLACFDVGMYLLTALLIVLALLLWEIYNNCFDYIRKNSKKFSKIME